MANATSRPNPEIPSPGAIAVFRPLAAATAAPAQSSPRSAGSISLRRRSSESLVSLTIAFGTRNA